MIKEIDKTHLQKRYANPRLKYLRYIAIDEFAVQKGHRYHTVVMDLTTGSVVFVGEGRSSSTLAPFFKRLKASRAKIVAVAMDMWPAYINAVTTKLPQAMIVFDRFHITQMLHGHLQDIRRELFHHEKDVLKKKILKGTRWLLLTNQASLKNPNQKKHLEEALEINKPLATAYYLKEELQLLWQQDSAEKAKAFLGQWVAKAIASGITRLKKFANTLLAHRTGIFNWFVYPLSTGPLEGMNNKIKVLKRKAYGYRDMEYFKLKIYALNESRYGLLR